MDQGPNPETPAEQAEVEKTPLGVTLAFIAIGGACVVFAISALSGRRSSAPAYVDPLSDLVAQRAPAGAAFRPTDLASHEVTFPGILSDKDRPTTALAAVRGNSAKLAAMNALADAGAAPPVAPAPVASAASAASAAASAAPSASSSSGASSGVPLPAQAVLEPSPVVTRPRDALTRAASESGQIGQAAAPSAPVGHEGGYQLQISSFRSAQEATKFADQLRARGHKAYVREAHVPGRGTWYRVRVGPFSSQQAAAAYRGRFEAKEHVVPFLLQPKEASDE
ncbi:SPOR domain-containing protein [Pendulispora brunnea]|uniref:SPOR domain-containing protein n=1 Tax=Pendulispora brunnea TaxID=2905690 RepID=A0ABZ2KLX6_9BACT